MYMLDEYWRLSGCSGLTGVSDLRPTKRLIKLRSLLVSATVSSAKNERICLGAAGAEFFPFDSQACPLRAFALLILAVRDQIILNLSGAIRVVRYRMVVMCHASNGRSTFA